MGKLNRTHIDMLEDRESGKTLKSLLESHHVDVTSYGAKGDGTTDDTQAFRDAMAVIAAAGGGTLFIPKTSSYYNVRDYVNLTSNVRITSNGALIKKTNYISGNVFLSRSYSGSGYGSGACNVIIEGLQFEGDFSLTEGCTVATLHHAQNVTVRNCIFRQCVVSGHIFDLGGCRNITVENCEFYGFNKQSGREYVEAIQLDVSSNVGLPSVSDTDTYDGLPTINVTVQNCKFLPLTLNGTTYPAPNAIGSHARYQNRWHTHIKVLDNYFEDGVNTDGGTSHTRGWVHGYHIDGMTIEGNTFVTTTAPIVTVIALISWNTAYLDGINYGDPNIANANYTPQCPKNITIKNNKFKGFKNVGADLGLVYIEGYNDAGGTPYYAQNIVLDNNKFIDCYDSTQTGGTNGYNIGSDCISMNRVADVVVSKNYAYNCRRLLYSNNYAKGLKVINNNCDTVYYEPLYVYGNSQDVVFSNNTIRGCGGGIYMYQITNLRVTGNCVTNDISSAYSAYGNMLAFKTCDHVYVAGNDLYGVAGTPYTAMSFYATCNKLFIKNNFVTNFAPISVSVDSTNVINSENA